MSKAPAFAPILAILALAGSIEARIESAVESLSVGLSRYLKDGNKNTLTDTQTALAEVKSKQARIVESAFLSAFNAADASWNATKKTAPETVDARVKGMVVAFVESIEAKEAEAKTAKEAKAAESKATKAAADVKAKREKARADKAAADALALMAAGAQVMSVASAVEFLRRAASGGNDAALDGIVALANEFTDAVQVESTDVALVNALTQTQPATMQ